MKSMSRFLILWVTMSLFLLFSCNQPGPGKKWVLNDQEYLETPGLSVLAFHNFYPSGKQGGIEIIHHGARVATNGFIRMERVNGRHFSYPEQAEREVDLEKQLIKTKVNYEDYEFGYTIQIWPDGPGLRLAVDLDEPIPAEWEGKLHFALEFFPPYYFGKSYRIGNDFGTIPRQAMGTLKRDEEGNLTAPILGHGKKLTLAGEDPLRKIVIEALTDELVLMDERNYSDRGWLWVRSVIPAGVTENAVEWSIRPNRIRDWVRDPMIAVSQVGYHPDQKKQAVIELDPGTKHKEDVSLVRIENDDKLKTAYNGSSDMWGKFLCYQYAIFDFSSVKEPGVYMVRYGDHFSHPFTINKDVYKEGVWQPTLEGYFPIQMCHIGVHDRQAIWHGPCHLDDALQAPLDMEHVDGYHQYEDSETDFAPLTTVPFLNEGGWHDAGDDDLAAGSQASTTHYLVLANEVYQGNYDQTTVNYDDQIVQMYHPDGIPDFVQQVKHGALNLLSGYRVAGHSFAGIIANREGRNITGDWASQTDQLFYDSRLGPKERTLTHSGVPDDRWVFTNRDTGLEYQVMAALAASSRTLKGYEDDLAQECLETALKAWDFEQTHEPVRKPNAYVPRNQELEEILAAAELLYTTHEKKYANHLVEMLPMIRENMERSAWGVARVYDLIDDETFKNDFLTALKTYRHDLDSTLASNPFGVPWRPRIWGIGWDIQRYALEHYYLVRKFPDLFDRELVLRVLNYVLGCHPGSSTSLVSGVGSHSITSAFGVYRHMWYYIPGGMVSGTALIRPDYPELKEGFPYLWQQSEYVMPGAGSYIFCVLAADDLLNH